MKILPYLFLILIENFIACRYVLANCKDHDWAKTSSRTQGGGFIWYPGYGKSDTLEKSRILAEGEGIRKLNSECGFPHKEIRIIERCEEKVGDEYQTFLRLSIKDEHCKQARYATESERSGLLNTSLAETYDQYKYLLEKKLNLTVQDCSRSGVNECYKRGKYEFYLGNLTPALEYFEQACKKEHVDSCYNAGITSSKLEGNETKTRGFFQVACDLGDGESCHKVSIIYIDKQEYNAAFKFSQQACKADIGKSCYNQAVLMKKLNLENSQEIMNKACLLSVKKACSY